MSQTSADTVQLLEMILDITDGVEAWREGKSKADEVLAFIAERMDRTARHLAAQKSHQPEAHP